MDAVPLLPGTEECMHSGILSSLHAANARVASLVANAADLLAMPVLVDAQTAGGLLAAVAAGQARDCVAQLRQAGFQHATVIGRVTQDRQGPHAIQLA